MTIVLYLLCVILLCNHGAFYFYNNACYTLSYVWAISKTTVPRLVDVVSMLCPPLLLNLTIRYWREQLLAGSETFNFTLHTKLSIERTLDLAMQAAIQHLSRTLLY